MATTTMPNQAKGVKQTEVKLLTKMTLPNQAKTQHGIKITIPKQDQTKRSADKLRSRAERKEDMHGKQR